MNKIIIAVIAVVVVISAQAINLSYYAYGPYKDSILGASGYMKMDVIDVGTLMNVTNMTFGEETRTSWPSTNNLASTNWVSEQVAAVSNSLYTAATNHAANGEADVNHLTDTEKAFSTNSFILDSGTNISIRIVGNTAYIETTLNLTNINRITVNDVNVVSNVYLDNTNGAYYLGDDARFALNSNGFVAVQYFIGAGWSNSTVFTKP